MSSQRNQLTESVDELLREQQAEPIPGWLLGLVVLAVMLCAGTIGLISYFLATR